MRKRAVPAATLLAAGMMLAAAHAPGAAEESPYLLQGGGEGEVRVLRGLETDQSFAPATEAPATEAPQVEEAVEEAVEQAPAVAAQTEGEAQPDSSRVDYDAFDRAEGRWLSEWQSAGGQTTTAKTTFDDYGRMASIPHRFATFYAADESGQWQGYWTQEGGRHRCTTKQDGSEHWGVIQLQFDEAYNHFEGTWDYCGEGDKWDWKGKRVAR
jgi:hypothetical protein